MFTFSLHFRPNLLVLYVKLSVSLMIKTKQKDFFYNFDHFSAKSRFFKNPLAKVWCSLKKLLTLFLGIVMAKTLNQTRPTYNP